MTKTFVTKLSTFYFTPRRWHELVQVTRTSGPKAKSCAKDFQLVGQQTVHTKTPDCDVSHSLYFLYFFQKFSLCTCEFCIHMCVISTCTWICSYVHIYIHIYIYICIYVYRYVFTCIHVYIHSNPPTHSHTLTHTHFYVYI